MDSSEKLNAIHQPNDPDAQSKSFLAIGWFPKLQHNHTQTIEWVRQASRREGNEKCESTSCKKPRADIQRQRSTGGNGLIASNKGP
jgi:hypothetical protein